MRRIPRSVLYVLLAGLVAAGIAQSMRHERVTAELRTFVTRARPAALIRVERHWPFLWGGGLGWNASLEPAGEIKHALGLPFGFQVEARRVHVQELEMAEDGFPRAFDLSLTGVRLPVLPAPEGPEVTADLRRPTLAELGLDEVRGNLRIQFERRMSDGVWSLHLAGLFAGLGRVELVIEGVPGPAFVQGDFADFALRRLTFLAADQGIAALVREWLAVRLRVDPAGLEQALLERLDRAASEQGWTLDAGSMAAVRAFVRSPGEIGVQLAPLHEVLLKNLGLYKPGDRFALLGTRVSAQAPFELEPPR